MADLVLPHHSTPVLDGNKMTRPWYAFFDALTKRENTKAAFVGDLAASPTVEDISTAFNAILEARQDAE
jgi:hypothetical protein